MGHLSDVGHSISVEDLDANNVLKCLYNETFRIMRFDLSQRRLHLNWIGLPSYADRRVCIKFCSLMLPIFHIMKKYY